MKSKILNYFILLIILLLLLFRTVFATTVAEATFAAGCFWCAEHDFKQVPGVIKVLSGYTGGQTANPNYEAVSAGNTGHYEAVRIFYDPREVTYQQLLLFFWHNVDPTDTGGQFCDRGNQYRSAIFYKDAHQKRLAELSKMELIKRGKFKTIATLIIPASTFYPAEEYHQGYAIKNPIRYHFYRYQCGRDSRLQELWGN